ncbi:hypothetical protein [Leifsonia sp. NPDC058248]|uniref:SMI1/KNR4 family protein n=1 Tax=Leifsonia sp. NPDC058248 TaxID=3346402 RepID=UPI0036D99FDF
MRALGAPVMVNLRPAISSAEIRQLESHFGVELPDGVRAIWEWHNGVDGARGANAANAARMLVPHLAFGDLAWSLEFADEFFSIVASANPTSDYAGRRFVSLLIGNVGLVVNLTPGEPDLTYLNDPMSSAMSDYPSMPIADRIDWWTWAIETGAWSLTEEGDWTVNLDLYPQGQNRNVLL